VRSQTRVWYSNFLLEFLQVLLYGEEILEMKMPIKNSPMLKGDRSKFHFILHSIDYKKERTEVENPDTKVFNYKGYIDFIGETFEHKPTTKYVKLNDKEYPITYTIEKEKFPIDEIVSKIHKEFQTRKLEGITLNLVTIYNLGQEKLI